MTKHELIALLRSGAAQRIGPKPTPVMYGAVECCPNEYWLAGRLTPNTTCNCCKSEEDE